MGAVVLACLATTCGRESLGPGELCLPGELRCTGETLEVCNDRGDAFVFVADCAVAGKVCAGERGCLRCLPGTRTCDGFDVLRCDAEGSGADRVATCDRDASEVCHAGSCVDACQLAGELRSYEGCEYWAVDLDNAVVADQGAAAAQQFSVALSNPSPLTAEVTVDILCTAADAASPALACAEGQPHQVEVFTVGPHGLRVVNLDPREVDGSSRATRNDGPGTFRSPHAFRISSTAPLVAYQFNPLDNVGVFSNDASLLLPVTALGARYIVLSWPQTLALTSESGTNGGIDLRSFVTVVGVADATTVTVELTTDILGGSDIGPAAAGQSITFALDRFEVVNLETDGFNADFTGTTIRASRPVAVFAGGEASDVPMFDDFIHRECCADHMEQQLFPETTLGTRFVAVKTPSRTRHVEQAGWNVAVIPDEPEWWRVLGTFENTTVTTNLPPPDDAFTLQRGESVILESERDFVLEASAPVAFGQFPGSQYTTGIPAALPGGLCPPGGDPSFILLPPIEQWRDDYLFLVPGYYAFDFLLIAAPTDATIAYDGIPLGEVLPCEYELIGSLGGGADAVEYQAIRCSLSAPAPAFNCAVAQGTQDDGVHRLRSTNGVPFGLVVYGWDRFVSYGYPGGADVELINPL